MDRYILNYDGTLTNNGELISLNDGVADNLIHVPHLAPHVIQIAMPRGENIKIKIIYSSHCWSEEYKQEEHILKKPSILVFDNAKRRIFNKDRFEKSKILPEFLAQLPSHKLYLTPSDRNYGVYNASKIVDDCVYTAFFTLKKNKGRLNRIRHSLLMRVESAYVIPQPSKGMKTKISVAIDKALKGEKLKYR